MGLLALICIVTCAAQAIGLLWVRRADARGDRGARTRGLTRLGGGAAPDASRSRRGRRVAVGLGLGLGVAVTIGAGITAL